MTTSATVPTSLLPSPVAATEASPTQNARLGLWIVQAILGNTFGMTGLLKLTQPIAELAQWMPWVKVVPEAFVRFVGLCEFAGALGLLLPAVTRMRPVMAAWSATGLAGLMIVAGLFDGTRGEPRLVLVNVVLAGLAVFVAKGEFAPKRN
jgi:putative oxidoreductase